MTADMDEHVTYVEEAEVREGITVGWMGSTVEEGTIIL